jgi:hypothetical protein
MFYYSLFWTVLLVVTAYFAARRPPHPVLWGLFLPCGAVAYLFNGTMVVSEVVLRLLVLLGIALLVWHLIRHRVRTFLPLLLVAVALPYGIVGWDASKNEAELERLRQKYPFESMAHRLPEPGIALRTPPTGDSAARLDTFEQAVQPSKGELGYRSPAYEFRRLHERTVRTFTNNPGFGVTRMVESDGLSERNLGDRRPREAPNQPGSPAVWGPGEPFAPTPDSDRKTLTGLHSDGVLDFVSSWTWGVVENRNRVAGFIPHQFREVPRAETWQVQRIELVGLLKHPEPVVYLSDKLPAMTELRDAPTRPLDAFETSGLGMIQKGDDGFAARRGAVVRFVGAIRSARQCVDCHGGERGDLLGAFSYTLRPTTTP